MLLNRWAAYLLEMYQPLTRLIFSVFSFFSILWLGAFSQGQQVVFSWLSFFQGVGTMMLILLYYRICDEFKDLETDRQFFPDRPVPSGRVLLQDLHILRGLTVILAFAINILWPVAIWPFLLLYLYAYLMGKWFFVPAMAEHRLWAFLTHAPISILGYVYLLVLTFHQGSEPVFKTLWAPQSLGIIFWLAIPGMAWELTRKTRVPDAEEDGYQTYSQILGYRGASLLTLSFVAVHAGLSYWLWFSQDFVPQFYLALVFGAIVAFYALLLGLFCWRPERFSPWLLPVSEAYVAAVLLLYPSHWLLT